MGQLRRVRKGGQLSQVGKGDSPGHDFTMVFNNETHKIDSCDEEKDLGITFDKFLSFDLHSQNVINKADKMLELIFSL